MSVWLGAETKQRRRGKENTPHRNTSERMSRIGYLKFLFFQETSRERLWGNAVRSTQGHLVENHAKGAV